MSFERSVSTSMKDLITQRKHESIRHNLRKKSGCKDLIRNHRKEYLVGYVEPWERGMKIIAIRQNTNRTVICVGENLSGVKREC